MVDRFAIQDAQYEFPYHYLPHLVAGSARRTRSLRWGRQYLCYLLYLAERIRTLAPGSMLDVGCGDGRLLSLLVEHIPSCRGVDLSSAAIRFARAFVPQARFDEVDAGSIAETFDVVSAIEVLEHVPDEHVAAFLQALAARCHPGGHVVISVPTTNVALTAKHYRHYDETLLRAQLASSGAPLEVQELAWVYRQPAWLRTLDRFVDNKFFRLEIAALDRVLWEHTWRRLRDAGPATGHHLVAILRRR